jgi:hypothetical protein
MTNATMPTANDRATALAAQLTALAKRFVDAVDELVPIVNEAVQIDAEYRAALAQAGQRETRPEFRELASEVLHGRLGALRPSVPFVTAESAQRAAEAMVTR